MTVYASNRFSQGFSIKPSRQGKTRILGFFILSLAFFITGAFVIAPRVLELRSTQAKADSELEDQSLVTVFDTVFDMQTRKFDELRSGENLTTTLSRLQVPSVQAEKFVAALSKEINLRTLKPGDVIMVEEAYQKRSIDELDLSTSTLPRAIELFTKDEAGIAFTIRASFDNALNQGAPSVLINKPQVYKEHVMIGGEVSGSLYSSIVSNGGNAQLVNSFSDIFGWQFDFYRDSRENDRYQMIVEKNVVDGRVVGYGQVLAAEYSQNKDIYRGFYFESKDKSIAGFFDQDGRSLKNAFLKSPVKLASITSRFNKFRFHPVQKRIKPHNGVDYGATRGTPFMAVADGQVVNAGYTPFNGNWVRVRHMNGYETEYLHATHLAQGIRVGKKVRQGQVIGFVGKTGLASGYHLHFGMKKNGSYVDPSSQRFARSFSIPTGNLADFKKKIAVLSLAFNTQKDKNNAIASLNAKGPKDG